MGNVSKNFSETIGAEGRTNAFNFDPAKLTIVTDKAHPLYDERHKLPVLPELVESIKLRGVIEPVIVWRDPDTGQTCVVDGRQRVKAAVEANLQLAKEGQSPKLVTAIAAKGKARDVMATMVIANGGRQEVTSIQKAQLAQRLQVEGYSEEHVAVFLHVSRSGLKNLLSLVETTKEVQAAVEARQLPITMAYKLASLTPDEQKAKLSTMLAAVSAPEPESAPQAQAGSKASKPLGKRQAAAKMREAAGEHTMRRRREIQAMLDEIKETYVAAEVKGVVDALRWVLGERKTLP